MGPVLANAPADKQEQKQEKQKKRQKKQRSRNLQKKTVGAGIVRVGTGDTGGTTATTGTGAGTGMNTVGRTTGKARTRSRSTGFRGSVMMDHNTRRGSVLGSGSSRASSERRRSAWDMHSKRHARMDVGNFG